MAADTAEGYGDDETVMEKVCRAIWRETYRHDTLMEWHEIKRGTMHHKRVVAAAKAACDLTWNK